MPIRRATAADAALVADIYLTSRAASPMPPGVHPPHEVLAHVRDVLIARHEVWLADEDAVLVLEDDDLHWLFVRPSAQGRGIGRALVELAQQERPDGLALWVFTANTPALAFYERHGFREVRRTDGDNEEGAPDIRLVWGGHPEG